MWNVFSLCYSFLIVLYTAEFQVPCYHSISSPRQEVYANKIILHRLFSLKCLYQVRKEWDNYTICVLGVLILSLFLQLDIWTVIVYFSFNYITPFSSFVPLGTDHLTWRGRGGAMVFCFVQKIFFGQHKS
jgi:hypothetical protein